MMSIDTNAVASRLAARRADPEASLRIVDISWKGGRTTEPAFLPASHFLGARGSCAQRTIASEPNLLHSPLPIAGETPLVASSRRSVVPLRQKREQPAGRIRRYLQPKEHEAQFRLPEVVVRFGEAFPSLGKISHGEIVLTLLDQVPRTNLGGSVPHQFPLRRVQRQFLVGFFEDQPVRLRHFSARRAQRSRAALVHARLDLAAVADFRAVKCGPQPHVVVVATGYAFVK